MRRDVGRRAVPSKLARAQRTMELSTMRTTSGEPVACLKLWASVQLGTRIARHADRMAPCRGHCRPRQMAMNQLNKNQGMMRDVGC